MPSSARIKQNKRTVANVIALGTGGGGGSGLTAGQRATLAFLKSASVYGASPEDLPELTGLTVSQSATADGTLTNEYKYTTNSDKIALLGGLPVKSDGSAYNVDYWTVKQGDPAPSNGILTSSGFGAGASWGTAYEFETDAPTVEARQANYGGDNTTAQAPVRFAVDRQYVSKVGNFFYGGTLYSKLAGLTPGTFKKIRIESKYALYSIRVAPGYTIRPVQNVNRVVEVDEGDSYTEPQTTRYGTGTDIQTNRANAHASYAAISARMLWKDPHYISVAVGLTGYYSVGGSRRRIPDRVADWKNLYNPHIITFMAGFNDGTQYAATASYALAAWAEARAANPNALFIIKGVPPSATISSKAPIEANLKTAAYDVWNDPFSLWIPISTAAVPYPNTLDPTDNTHWSNQGHADAGVRMAADIRAAFIAKFGA